MSNFRVGYLNYADLATLTAVPALTNAGPVTYLQNNRRGLIAQASSTASQDIKGTWGGTAYTISQLALWRHNLAYNDTIQLQLYTDTAWTTLALDTTALAAYASGLFDNWGWGFYNLYFAPVAGVKSFKVTVAASAAALQAARLFLGAYTEAAYNPKYGFTLGQGTLSKLTRSEGGSLDSEARATWRTATFDMFVKTEADRAAWWEIGRYCDVVKPAIVSLYPGVGGTQERDYTIMGKFEPSPAQKISNVNLFDFSIKLSEL